jgi:competence protein ComGC
LRRPPVRVTLDVMARRAGKGAALLRAAGRPALNQQGFGFVAILLAMLIVAVLYFGYFKMQNSMSQQRTTAVSSLDASRAVACRANKANIESNIQLWAVDHPGEQPTIDALRASGLNIPTCPSGGTYTIAAGKVHCSIHG